MDDQAGNHRKLLKENDLLKRKISELEELAAQHRRVESEIRKRDARYQQLVDHAPDGIFTIDGEGRFLFVNTAFCRMLGATRDECLRLNILDTYPNNATPDGLKRLTDLQCGEALRFERPLRRQDGSIIIVSANAGKIRTATFRPSCATSPNASAWRRRSAAARKNTATSWKISTTAITKSIWPAISPGQRRISRHLRYTREELIGMNGRQYMEEESYRTCTVIIWSSTGPEKEFRNMPLKLSGRTERGDFRKFRLP